MNTIELTADQIAKLKSLTNLAGSAWSVGKRNQTQKIKLHGCRIEITNKKFSPLYSVYGQFLSTQATSIEGLPAAIAVCISDPSQIEA